MHLYSGPLSLFSRKVEITLAEKGLSFSRTLVPFSQTRGYAPRHEAVQAANPKGQAPVLVDGDLTLYDSTIILEYLEDTYPEPALYPRDPQARARCRQLELEADEVPLEPVRKLMFRTEPPGDAAQRANQERGAAEAERLVARDQTRLDDRLRDSAFLLERYSVADIATFMVTFWGLRLGAQAITGLPHLLAWYRRMATRPAIATVLAEITEADRQLSHPVPGVELP